MGALPPWAPSNEGNNMVAVKLTLWSAFVTSMTAGAYATYVLQGDTVLSEETLVPVGLVATAFALAVGVTWKAASIWGRREARWERVEQALFGYLDEATGEQHTGLADDVSQLRREIRELRQCMEKGGGGG